ALSRGPSPGPPSHLRADLEHVAQPLHPGIRDPEVRRRLRLPQLLRITSSGHGRSQGAPAPGAFRLPVRPVVVHRRPLTRRPAPSRHGSRGPGRNGRGLLRAQGAFLTGAPMYARRRRWWRVAVAAAAVGMATVAAAPLRDPALRAAGQALVADDHVARADVVVISVGADGAGVLE